jgi:iron complex transport system substrate-binding protein
MITSHLPSTQRRRSQRRVSTVAAASVALLALAGCGSQATAEPDATPSASAGYPVTVDNCGTEVTLDAAPERIVTIKSSTTELLLALGLGDSIVGAAALDGPVPEEFAADLEVIGDGVPGQEAVLALEPDPRLCRVGVELQRRRRRRTRPARRLRRRDLRVPRRLPR